MGLTLTLAAAGCNGGDGKKKSSGGPSNATTSPPGGCEEVHDPKPRPERGAQRPSARSTREGRTT